MFALSAMFILGEIAANSDCTINHNTGILFIYIVGTVGKFLNFLKYIKFLCYSVCNSSVPHRPILMKFFAHVR